MKKFNLEDYQDMNVCMRLRSNIDKSLSLDEAKAAFPNDEAVIFYEFLHKHGRRWSGGRSYANSPQFYRDFVIYFNIGEWDSTKHVQRGYLVLEFSDFDWSDYLPGPIYPDFTMSLEEILKEEKK